jgi:hypothetical protein
MKLSGMKLVGMKFVRTKFGGGGLGSSVLDPGAIACGCFLWGHEKDAPQYFSGFATGTQESTAEQKAGQQAPDLPVGV